MGVVDLPLNDPVLTASVAGVDGMMSASVEVSVPSAALTIVPTAATIAAPSATPAPAPTTIDRLATAPRKLITPSGKSRTFRPRLQEPPAWVSVTGVLLNRSVVVRAAGASEAPTPA